MNAFWSIHADRYGHRRTVAIMSVLMIVGGLRFAVTDNLWIFVLAPFLARSEAEALKS